jgi:hypothetical protein
MKKMSLREQVIAVTAGVLILFYVAYNWFGLGDLLSELRTKRTALVTLRDQYAAHRNSLRFRPVVVQEYERYRSYSIPRDPTKDPADEFSEYINNTIQRIDPTRRPALHPTELDEIEGVESYEQILLPVDITIELAPLVQFLKTIDQERLLIRRLEIRCRENQHPNMSVKTTISRFVSIDDLQGPRSDEEARR